MRKPEWCEGNRCEMDSSEVATEQASKQSYQAHIGFLRGYFLSTLHIFPFGEFNLYPIPFLEK